MSSKIILQHWTALRLSPSSRTLPSSYANFRCLSKSTLVEHIAALACCRRWQLHSLPFTILSASHFSSPYSHYPRCATTRHTDIHRRQQRRGPSAATKCAPVCKLRLTWPFASTDALLVLLPSTLPLTGHQFSSIAHWCITSSREVENSSSLAPSLPPSSSAQ